MPADDLEKTPELKDLISLSEAAEKSGLSSSHIRLLVNKGELWGIKLGRNWFTTTQEVEKYLESSRKPGPRPKII